ncbi:lycopene cyclase [Polaribacter sp. WD7]|uniref:lycopene cyclase family protein n=1 Tax=Polaribacter sp. WD7 TaxID=2269061 RepID=UPI000DF24C4E|nr:lycopene cyclase family protein [Polaribacter sp. WD7]RCS27177.1 lycopene cyclase [Polaribacter sp. WD7]
MDNFDYIIVGSGASGLMMVYRMSLDAFFDDKSILLIDKEKKSINDRTWCFWETPNGEWDDVLTTSWKNIAFKANQFSTEENITPYQYKMIRSADFYSKIWKQIENKKNITFLKEKVYNIAQEQDRAKVTTTTKIFFSDVVINSILFDDGYLKQEKYPVLQQHFVGFFVKTKDVFFDDETATFMDFTVDQKQQTRFMYVLPYSKKEALFEYTLFTSKLLPYEEYKGEIEKYLIHKGITEYEIVEQEQGAIPMTCYEFWKNNSENIIHIGTAGGWSKASTGFTFKNINKNSIRLVNYLKQKKALQNFHKKNKFWFYDLLLLDILHEKNHLGSFIFSEMFQKIPAHKILKFLDDETSIREDLQIISKMSPFPFVKALLKRVFLN